MSRSFFKILKIFLDTELFVSKNQMNNKIIGLSSAGFGSAIFLGHGLYAFKTAKIKIIKIHKTYTFNRNGFTEFMIMDDNGNHYNVNNSFWYWKWDSIEDWNKLESNNDIIIKYYGWRVPLLGLFPNVIMSSVAPVSNLMSNPEYRVLEYNRNLEKQKISN